jgi:hypothetical protein
MTFYERFEYIITLISSSVIRVIVVIALWRLISGAGKSGGYAFSIVYTSRTESTNLPKG